MSESKKLYKQIEDLNNKIKKLEYIVNKKNTNSNQQNYQNYHNYQNQLNQLNQQNKSNSSLVSYRIHFPKESYFNKKYIGLKFDNNPNEYDSDEKSNSKNLISFIKLTKSNIIINYSIQLEINYTPINSIPCSISVCIKTSSDTKIKVIKGSKYNFDLTSTNIFNNTITISNNLLYSAEEGEELCIVADFDFASGFNCAVNSKKSIIKLLYV